MAIKNKDGTVYKLDSPIPVMLEQDRWDDFHVHNFDWNTAVESDTATVNPMSTDFKNLKKEGFVEELERTKPEPQEIKIVESDSVSPVVEELSVESEPVEETMPDLSSEIVLEETPDPPQMPQRKLPDNIRKTFVYCLPAVMTERVDELYGDKYTSIRYERPFSFEAVIVENADLVLKMWTTVDKITRGSVLFPRLKEKRWWRVEQIQDKTGGFLVYGVPSDYQPSFNSL